MNVTTSGPSNFGDLKKNCLALTGSFETGYLPPKCFGKATGNFDGCGVSFGALQWNLKTRGRGTLPELLRGILGDSTKYEAVHNVIGEARTNELIDLIDLVDPVGYVTRNWMNPRGQLYQPIKNMFMILGTLPHVQEAQVVHAQSYFDRATHLFHDYRLVTQRGYALMFDIAVQIWNISSAENAVLKTAMRSSKDEEWFLEELAKSAAASTKPEWGRDVHSRKMTIATGFGQVHGMDYDLAGQFNITLDRVVF
jgi:hypothetical protein